MSGKKSVCRFCKFDNGDVDYVFCAKCKRPKAGTREATPFPEQLEVHPEASLDSFVSTYCHTEEELKSIFGNWRPDAILLQKVGPEVLSPVALQTMIRHYGWHLAGPQPKRSASDIDRERGIKGASSATIDSSTLHLVRVFREYRRSGGKIDGTYKYRPKAAA